MKFIEKTDSTTPPHQFPTTKIFVEKTKLRNLLVLLQEIKDVITHTCMLEHLDFNMAYISYRHVVK